MRKITIIIEEDNQPAAKCPGEASCQRDILLTARGSSLEERAKHACPNCELYPTKPKFPPSYSGKDSPEMFIPTKDLQPLQFPAILIEVQKTMREIIDKVQSLAPGEVLEKSVKENR